MVNHSQRPGLVLAIASLAAFMASLDVFIVNVALDDIGADFSGATLAQVSWVLSAYAIVYAALLVPGGRIADRYGRKGGFLVGLIFVETRQPERRRWQLPLVILLCVVFVALSLIHFFV